MPSAPPTPQLRNLARSQDEDGDGGLFIGEEGEALPDCGQDGGMIEAADGSLGDRGGDAAEDLGAVCKGC